MLGSYDGSGKLPLSLIVRASGLEKEFPVDVYADPVLAEIYYIGGGIILLIILLIILGLLKKKSKKKKKEYDFEA